MALSAETQSLIEHLGSLSYIGIFFAAFLSNVVIPVPEEIVVIGFGYLIGTGTVNAWIVIPLIILGMLASDSIMYVLARHRNRYVTGFYNKFFSNLVSKREEWVEAHTKKVIFFSRFLIQLRFIGPFIAGQRRIPWKTFVLYDLLALIVYVPLYTFIGWYFRNRLGEITKGVNVLHHLIILGIILLVVIAIGKVFRDIMFRGYTLSLKGKRSERTWLSFLYLRKTKKETEGIQDENNNPASF